MIVSILTNPLSELSVTFECCMCLRKLIKKENLKFNYDELLENVAPVIIKLLSNLEISSVLWPII